VTRQTSDLDRLTFIVLHIGPVLMRIVLRIGIQLVPELRRGALRQLLLLFERHSRHESDGRAPIGRSETRVRLVCGRLFRRRLRRGRGCGFGCGRRGRLRGRRGWRGHSHRLRLMRQREVVVAFGALVRERFDVFVLNPFLPVTLEAGSVARRRQHERAGRRRERILRTRGRLVLALIKLMAVVARILLLDFRLSHHGREQFERG